MKSLFGLNLSGATRYFLARLLAVVSAPAIMGLLLPFPSPDHKVVRDGANLMIVRIGLIGDFIAGYEPHLVTNDFFAHAAAHLNLPIAATWLPTPEVTAETLQPFDALWITPGSPYRSLDGALFAIRFARERGIPLGGACAGFQHVVLEYAQNVLAIPNAAHAEYDPPPGSALILHRMLCVVAGKELPITLAPDSQAARAYARTDIVERYYCNFGVNPEYRSRLGALQVTGWDAADEPRVVELPTHPYYVATLFVPQSTPATPHPLATSFLAAAHTAARSRPTQIRHHLPHLTYVAIRTWPRPAFTSSN